jgi:hypothetical protein
LRVLGSRGGGAGKFADAGPGEGVKVIFQICRFPCSDGIAEATRELTLADCVVVVNGEANMAYAPWHIDRCGQLMRIPE